MRSSAGAVPAIALSQRLTNTDATDATTGAAVAAPVGFRTFEPEKLDAYEAGLKASFNGAVSGFFNVAGFYNKFSNQQLRAGFSPAPGAVVPNTTGILNVGRSRIYGADIGIRFGRDVIYHGITPEFWGSLDMLAGGPELIHWGVPNCGKGQPMQTAHTGHSAAPARFRGVRVGVRG